MIEKRWKSVSNAEKENLYRLLTVWAILGIVALAFFVYNIFSYGSNFCIICNIALLITIIVAILCVWNGKTNCSTSIVFAFPIILYSFFISNFNFHLPYIDTIYYTTIWLLPGLLILMLFSETTVKILFYTLISFLTIGLQLKKADHLLDAFIYFKPLILNPFVLFLTIMGMLALFRWNFLKIIVKQQEIIDITTNSIVKVIRDMPFMVARLRAERDEEGNLAQLYFDTVNNRFESAFHINLYEVKDQKADYIFNLIFKQKFDLNRYILNLSKKTTEFHATKLNKWFKILVIQPNITQYFIVFEDITQTKLELAELEDKQHRYKVLLEAIPDIFFVIDKDGIFEDFVVKESHLFKISDANITGSSIFDVGFPPNMAGKIHECIQLAIKHDSIETIEYQLNTPNGTFLFEMRLAKLSNFAVIAIARDITKRKTAEFKLEKALVKAKESDRLKSAFLSNLSHEIRTPLNVITNLTQILAESDLTEFEKLEFSDAIMQNGKQLMNMIDNTVHLSKIETQSVVVEHQFCAVNQMLRNVYNKYLVLLPDARIVKLNLKLSVPNSEFGFETDPALLSEILSILVDNAIKYTEKGEVSLGYEMFYNEKIIFYVSDTGIGIPKDEYEHIFTRFYRIQNPVNEKTSGSGTGLSIAQHYVSLLGGKLEFESEEKTGTRFWFSLAFSKGKGYLSIAR